MKLKDYLIENFITETEFAEKIGCRQPAVSRYIHEKTIPRPHLMKKIFTTTDGQVTPHDFPNRFRDGKIAKN